MDGSIKCTLVLTYTSPPTSIRSESMRTLANVRATSVQASSFRLEITPVRPGWTLVNVITDPQTLQDVASWTRALVCPRVVHTSVRADVLVAQFTLVYVNAVASVCPNIIAPWTATGVRAICVLAKCTKLAFVSTCPAFIHICDVKGKWRFKPTGARALYSIMGVTRTCRGCWNARGRVWRGDVLITLVLMISS